MDRLTGLVRIVAAIVLAATVGACAAGRPPLGPPGMSPTKLVTMGPAPIKGAAARFTITLATSVPGDFALIMQNSLKQAAAKRGLTLAAAGDASATYTVKGYLSAVGDYNSILLVYVWDVFDATGRHIHRFSGQQSARGVGADPWSGVTSDMIEKAAAETIDALADWVRV